MRTSATQRRNMVATAMLIALIAAFVGCGGKSSSSQGNTTVFVTDAPADSVLAFRVTVTAATLVDSSGHAVAAMGLPRPLELRHLQLAPTIMFPANLPAGTYTSLHLTLSDVEGVLSAGGGNVQTFNATTSPAILIANPAVAVPIKASITKTGVLALMLDFDLRNSLTRDQAGNYVYNAVVQSAAPSTNNPGWPLVGARGTVVNVGASSLTVQLFDGSLKIPVQTNSDTKFSADLGNISGIGTGQVVEVDAQYNNGTYTAQRVQSAVSPTESKRGIVVTGPQGYGSPMTLVVQN